MTMSIGAGTVGNYPTRYFLNAAVTGLAVIAYAIFNRAIGNEDFQGSKARASGSALLGNLVFGNAITHAAKANIRQVDSQKKQCMALAGFLASVVAVDAMVGGISSTRPIGVMTAVLGAGAAGHLIKIGCYRLIGRRPYTLGGVESTHNDGTSNIAKHCINAGVLFVTSLATAIIGHTVKAKGLTVVIYNLFSTANRKIGKTGLKLVQERFQRILLVCANVGVVMGANILIGASMPSQQDSKSFNTSAPTNSTLMPEHSSHTSQAWSWAVQYLGVGTATAVTALLMDLLIRAYQVPKTTDNHTSGEKVLSPSWARSIKNLALLTMTTVAALTVSGVNAKRLWSFDESTVNLGIALWQLGLGFHSLREAVKGCDNKMRISVISLSMITTAVLSIISWKTLDDHSKPFLNSWAFLPFAVGMGNAATMFAKTLRNYILPKPGHVRDNESRNNSTAPDAAA